MLQGVTLVAAFHTLTLLRDNYLGTTVAEERRERVRERERDVHLRCPSTTFAMLPSYVGTKTSLARETK